MAANPSDVRAAFIRPTAEELGFDPDVLRARYLAERDKRLRADGNAQYQEVTGDFERFVEDPYIQSRILREPIAAEIDVAIIGGGFGGMLAAARLEEAGITNFRIIERGGDFGGTWYWNRYPGAQCDIESYIYLPLLEETGYIPKEKYSYAPEIFEHAQRIGRHFNLYERTHFQTLISASSWDEDSARWQVLTDRGDHFKARFVVMCSGPLNRPKLPAIPGIENFKGHTFHTSRWDYAYTGGDSTGNLHKLHDKRVGVIGTGATGIQCVPAVGRDAEHLYVFQRTPSAIDERGNKPTDAEWAKSLTPGWQARRNHNFAAILSGIPQEEDLVADRWTDLFRALGELLSVSPDSGLSAEDGALLAEIADFRKMNGIRARVDTLVQNPSAAAALRPWYKQWCKRPTFNDEFLPTFNRPNVTMVDTNGGGVERVTATGVVVDGVEYPVDCLIFATGFEVGTAYTRRAGFDVQGRDGLALSDYWANGMRTFHGFLSHGFPNCFHMGLTQTGLSPNLTYMLNWQAIHISHIVEQVLARGASVVEATPHAEASWVHTVGQPGMMSAYLTECTPGYYNAEGKAGRGEGFFEGHYPNGAVQFFDMLTQWRAQGDLEGLELR